MYFHQIRFICLLLISLQVSVGHADDEILIITHPDNPVNSLNAKQVKRIWLGRLRNYPDGHPIELINFSSNHPSRQTAIKRITGKSSARVNAQWASLIFSGEVEILPQQVETEEELLLWLAQHPRALAYWPKSEEGLDIKILLRLEHLAK